MQNECITKQGCINSLDDDRHWTHQLGTRAVDDPLFSGLCSGILPSAAVGGLSYFVAEHFKNVSSYYHLVFTTYRSNQPHLHSV